MLNGSQADSCQHQTKEPLSGKAPVPASWTAAHLPALSPAQLSAVKSAVSVGVAPVPPNTPPRVASVITEISHDAFVNGMHAAFLVAAAVALAGAAIALITKRGSHAH
jgi:hypothetical protein